MITALIITIGLVGAAGAAAYAYKKRLHIWLAGDFTRPRARPNPDEPIDLMVVFVDHFEMAGKPERLNAWVEGYPRLAQKFRDSDGKPPQHTWFYAIDLMHEHELEPMANLVKQGLGEVELHWHHDHDDRNEFIKDLQTGLAKMQEYGFMRPYRDDQRACFSFIHGNWSLDNSRGRQFCGIDDEIKILLDEGCYADFTFPALFHLSQPKMPNQILYATDDGKAKSYDRGRLAKVGKPPQKDELQIFQGPIAINWRDWRFRWHPTIEDGDINTSRSQGLPARIKCWVDRRIHVPGQPNWWFVKLFSHGAQDHASVLSDATEQMHQYLADHYNDGTRYRLHYVTAREAYNMVRAAEDGKQGNPNEYRDYIIPPPLSRERQGY